MLIDSRSAIERCLNQTLAASDLLPLQAGDVDRYVGPPIADAFRELLHESGRDSVLAPELVKHFRTIYPEISREETRLMPGIAPILDELSGSYPLAVATSKAEHLAIDILTFLNIADRFIEIVGPAPDALDESKSLTLARAIELVSASSDRVMIGDRKYDILAGKANGCRTIGVTWGSGSYAELQIAGADAIVDSAEALLRAVRL